MIYAYNFELNVWAKTECAYWIVQQIIQVGDAYTNKPN